MDKRLSQAQLIQPGKFLRTLFGKLAGPLMKIAVSWAKGFSAPFVTVVPPSAADGAIQKKNVWKRCFKS